MPATEVLACVILLVTNGVVEVYRVTDDPAAAILPAVLSVAPAASNGALVYWLELLIDNVLLLNAPGAAGLAAIVIDNDLLLAWNMLPGLPYTVKFAVLVPAVDAL